eukprot:m.111628 g.111628  ORF g.111628 m.111628 type:complete len:75 (-) comp16126_c2_seq2:1053-1277(-)
MRMGFALHRAYLPPEKKMFESAFGGCFFVNLSLNSSTQRSAGPVLPHFSPTLPFGMFSARCETFAAAKENLSDS